MEENFLLLYNVKDNCMWTMYQSYKSEMWKKEGNYC